MNYPFQGCTVTLTTSATAYNVVNLVKAAQLALHPTAPYNWDGTCFFLRLFADSANLGSIYVGGQDIATTNYGYPLTGGGNASYGPLPLNGVPASSVYVMGSINSQVLHVEAGVI